MSDFTSCEPNLLNKVIPVPQIDIKAVFYERTGDSESEFNEEPLNDNEQTA
jgi:hypothetical protein